MKWLSCPYMEVQQNKWINTDTDGNTLAKFANIRRMMVDHGNTSGHNSSSLNVPLGLMPRSESVIK